MSNMNGSTPVQGVARGILHPKLRNRFVVRILNSDTGELHKGFEDLCQQIIRVDIPSLDPAIMSVGDHFAVTVEDDVTNRAMKSVYEWIEKNHTLKDNLSFDVMVDITDGNTTTVERYEFKGCWFSLVEHSPLDYESHGNVKMQINTPAQMGSAWASLDKNVRVILETMFSALNVTLSSDSVPGAQMTVRHRLVLGFENFDHKYNP